jgi:hypothetical protein
LPGKHFRLADFSILIETILTRISILSCNSESSDRRNRQCL